VAQRPRPREAQALEAAGTSSSGAVAAAAGTTGTAGQDLDETRPSYELVIQRVTKGGGAMPSFAGSLSRRQIEVIARYVARSAG
jgi:mono/diheme cytochrome c family protein